MIKKSLGRTMRGLRIGLFGHFHRFCRLHLINYEKWLKYVHYTTMIQHQGTIECGPHMDLIKENVRFTASIQQLYNNPNTRVDLTHWGPPRCGLRTHIGGWGTNVLPKFLKFHLKYIKLWICPPKIIFLSSLKFFCPL
jgi:hypothetical protein